MNENEKQERLQIELPQNVAQGEYANFAIITHGSSDFVVDFARVLPGVSKAQVCSRIIQNMPSAYSVRFRRMSCAMRRSSARSRFPIMSQV